MPPPAYAVNARVSLVRTRCGSSVVRFFVLFDFDRRLCERIVQLDGARLFRKPHGLADLPQADVVDIDFGVLFVRHALDALEREEGRVLVVLVHAQVGLLAVQHNNGLVRLEHLLDLVQPLHLDGLLLQAVDELVAPFEQLLVWRVAVELADGRDLLFELLHERRLLGDGRVDRLAVEDVGDGARQGRLAVLVERLPLVAKVGEAKAHGAERVARDKADVVVVREFAPFRERGAVAAVRPRKEHDAVGLDDVLGEFPRASERKLGELDALGPVGPAEQRGAALVRERRGGRHRAVVARVHCADLDPVVHEAQLVAAHDIARLANVALLGEKIGPQVGHGDGVGVEQRDAVRAGEHDIFSRLDADALQADDEHVHFDELVHHLEPERADLARETVHLRGREFVVVAAAAAGLAAGRGGAGAAAAAAARVDKELEHALERLGALGEELGKILRELARRHVVAGNGGLFALFEGAVAEGRLDLLVVRGLGRARGVRLGDFFVKVDLYGDRERMKRENEERIKRKRIERE